MNCIHGSRPSSHTWRRSASDWVAQWGRRAGLVLQDVTGLAFDPFTGRASLSRDTRVNYLAHFTREGPAAR